MRRYGLWQEGDAACAERNLPTYNEVEEEGDSRDSGDGGDGEDLVDRGHGYLPTLCSVSVESNCLPIGQVKVGESSYEEWSPDLAGREHDDVSLTK